ncbi:hypothetical protein MHYP_G00170250 [Metynnis hypsauchen]
MDSCEALCELLRKSTFGEVLCGIHHEPCCQTLHVRQKEGNLATLYCGRLTSGKVTWSRDTNGQRVDILTTHNGKMTKHIADPDRRYTSQADVALIILRVSQSDAGRYYCSGATVELSVTSGTILRYSLITLAVSCFFAVVLVLFSLRYFYKRKEDCEMPYDDVYTSIEYIAFNKEQSGRVALNETGTSDGWEETAIQLMGSTLSSVSDAVDNTGSRSS